MRSERLLTSLLVAASLLLSAGLAAQSPQRTPTPTPAAAEDDKAAEKGKDRKSGDEKPPKEEKPSVTHHEIRIGGTPVKYTATAGYIGDEGRDRQVEGEHLLHGYSRPAQGEKPEQFHGIQEDLESVGEFIRLYAMRYARWASPKFLAGESYGTTRAAGLSGTTISPPRTSPPNTPSTTSASTLPSTRTSASSTTSPATWSTSTSPLS